MYIPDAGICIQCSYIRQSRRQIVTLILGQQIPARVKLMQVTECRISCNLKRCSRKLLISPFTVRDSYVKRIDVSP
jgi:hypothetical protein